MAVEIYTEIDELVDIGCRLGYNGGGVQLKPGAIRVGRSSCTIGDVTVVRHGARGAIEYWGDPPGDKFTFIISLSFEWYCVNLEAPLADEIVVLPPGTEVSITTYGHDQFILYVPVGLLKQYLGDWFSISHITHASVRRVRIDQNMRAQLVDVLARVSHGINEHASTENQEHQICEALAAVLRSAGTERNASVRIETRNKAIRRARDFIASNLDANILISEVSAVAGVSERTLQRLFKEAFQLGPLQYIRAQRLEAARQVLSRSDPNSRSISRIAYEHGFLHTGRFAMAFKRQFGVIPSDFGRNDK